ncbi:MAG TPA: tryptophanase [Phycisphaerales bacterium]|nr:tryptophanase [Phycisphaerales bacterium]
MPPPQPTPQPTPPPSPPFEPFRFKSVEPIRLTTAFERRGLLDACGWNLFRVPSDAVMIDLLTDSGTGAMSSAQWSAMMRGDESYAGSASSTRLVETLTRITGIGHVLPTHQGRVAERLLVETIIGDPSARNPRGGAGAGMVVPNNAHFDTTRHMIEASGAEALNLLARAGTDPDNDAPFKGDIDIAALEKLLNTRGDDVPFIMLTVTCNSNGGQPVSLANMRAVRNLCDAFAKPLILDACRFAENAFLIKQREANQSHRSVAAIVREMFDLCDGVAMSTRKDGLCNVGGLLLLRDENLHRRACRLCVLTQGFQMTYGSLPGRDLEAIAVGMQEVMNETYLAQRGAMIAHFAQTLERGGVKIVRPAGGHAVFIDAGAFCPHLDDNAAHALACAIYEHAGVRGTPIGSALVNRASGAAPQLVRLAVPRRTYSQAHLQYAAASICELKRQASSIKPRSLPHDLDPQQQHQQNARAPLEAVWR